MAEDFRDVDLRDAHPDFEAFLRAGYSPKANVFMNRAVARLLAPVCEHPAALLVLADALATCDSCGRVFELKDFGK